MGARSSSRNARAATSQVPVPRYTIGPIASSLGGSGGVGCKTGSDMGFRLVQALVRGVAVPGAGVMSW
ncbi:hypothetical protein Aglo02_20850 [Actinokineospora globicatena]|nr:hypothetical protein Aglo02_20850 [Actinokineospora globicatena]